MNTETWVAWAWVGVIGVTGWAAVIAAYVWWLT